MQANIGITPENLADAAHALNIFLADEHILYIKSRNAHWNVEGPDFYTKHKFFEEQYNALEDIIDEIAERIRSLEHYPSASLKDFLRLTHLTEQTRENNTSKGFINYLLEDHEAIIIHLRGYVNKFADEWKDIGSSDFITGLIEKHEKMAWILRAHLS